MENNILFLGAFFFLMSPVIFFIAVQIAYRMIITEEEADIYINYGRNIRSKELDQDDEDQIFDYVNYVITFNIIVSICLWWATFFLILFFFYK